MNEERGTLWKRILRWTRKHDRNLTIFGAWLILLTFVYKEVVSNYRKDRASEIEVTESKYAILAIQDVVYQTNRDVQDIKRHLQPNGRQIEVEQPKSEKPLEEELGTREARFALLRTLLFAVDDFPECASGSRDLGLPPSIEELKKSAKLFTLPENKSLSASCEQTILNEASKKGETLRLASVESDYEGNSFFFTGWLLTLVGKLSKKEAIDEVERT